MAIGALGYGGIGLVVGGTTGALIWKKHRVAGALIGGIGTAILSAFIYAELNKSKVATIAASSVFGVTPPYYAKDGTPVTDTDLLKIYSDYVAAVKSILAGKGGMGWSAQDLQNHYNTLASAGGSGGVLPLVPIPSGPANGVTPSGPLSLNSFNPSTPQGAALDGSIIKVLAVI